MDFVIFRYNIGLSKLIKGMNQGEITQQVNLRQLIIECNKSIKKDQNLQKMQGLRVIRKCLQFKNSQQLINKLFLCIDTFVSTLCLLILILSNNRSQCLASFYLFWCLFYLSQAITHYLLVKLPHIDVIKFDSTIKKLIGIVCFVEVFYLLLVVVFWQRAHVHPLYCAMCEEYGYPFLVGIVFVFHFIASAGFAINLIHLFITRKYYLIALGGFDVEQRIAIEREEALRRVGLIEPNYAYPIQSSIKSDKYYKFEDVVEPGVKEDVCSICLNKKLQTENIIRTKCNHFYHRICIQKWATVNSRCPDCRTQFEQDFTQRKILSSQNKEQALDTIHQNNEQDQN